MHPSTVDHDAAHLHLDQALRLMTGIGLALVLLLPAARGHTVLLGWTPLWLLVLPATAWWALHRFRISGWHRAAPTVARAPRRQARPLARRAQRTRIAARRARAAVA